jgi:signal transduction histidine kinase/ActR/RegA family two-component response regulator
MREGSFMASDQDKSREELITEVGSLRWELRTLREQVQGLRETAAGAEAMRRAKEEADELNRAKDQFLAMVSHELRTPLNAILGWTQLLEMGALEGEQERRDALGRIAGNARVQAQLVEDILDVSRIINNKLRVTTKPMPPDLAVRAAIDALSPAAMEKGVRIEYQAEPSGALVSADEARLQQVVWNLLTNAVKFSPKGGVVRVKLERAQSAVRIRVSDEGCGIPQEFLPHVFDRFSQSEAGEARHLGGLGLGLAIVKHLVERHAGTIRAESPGKGRGATFTVMLPVVSVRGEEGSAAAAAKPARMTAGEAAQRLRGLRVLAVDDEASARELVSAALKKYGADVEVVESAREGLERLSVWRPDVLVSDLAMPEMDGHQLIEAVRKLGPEAGGNTPAVALTAFASADDKSRAVAAGFDVHVSKPVETRTLIEVISRLGRGERERHEGT